MVKSRELWRCPGHPAVPLPGSGNRGETLIGFCDPVGQAVKCLQLFLDHENIKGFGVADEIPAELRHRPDPVFLGQECQLAGPCQNIADDDRVVKGSGPGHNPFDKFSGNIGITRSTR